MLERREGTTMTTGIFRTTLCDVLGIEYPIVQSGMGGVAGPKMVAEVSNAGGLGILAGLNMPPDDLRAAIRRLRELTSRPFGVNLWLHSALRPPVDPASVSDAVFAATQTTLNAFRDRLGIPRSSTRPPRAPDLLDAAISVILDERVPIFSTALVARRDAELVRRCHERGIKVLTMVATVEDARAEAQSGVDVIVAQGGEAGGHRSIGDKPARPEAALVGTIALVPQVVDAVRIPVVAAGGLADGRGLVAALALGASGILLGTRFVATREATVPEFWKKALLESESDATTVTDVFSGLWARGLRNTFSDEYAASGAPVLPPLVQRATAQDIYTAAAEQQSREYFPMWSGQSVGLIRDLPGAGEVVHAIIREARTVLAGLEGRVRLG
jgi:nitronate monooxygenase